MQSRLVESALGWLLPTLTRVSLGLLFLETIRKAHPHLPVVLLITGYADITEAKAMHKGAFAILDKPIDRKRIDFHRNLVRHEAKKMASRQGRS